MSKMVYDCILELKVKQYICNGLKRIKFISLPRHSLAGQVVGAAQLLEVIGGPGSFFFAGSSSCPRPNS